MPKISSRIKSARKIKIYTPQVRRGKGRGGMGSRGMGWYGMVWYDMMWYGTLVLDTDTYRVELRAACRRMANEIIQVSNHTSQPTTHHLYTHTSKSIPAVRKDQPHTERQPYFQTNQHHISKSTNVAVNTQTQTN